MANKLKDFRIENRNKPFPTPCPELICVLLNLVDSVEVVLCNNFVGAYLQGSFAVGDFDLHSDVDFVMVIEKELSHEEVHGLHGVHERFYCVDILWAQHLESTYFPEKVLWDHARIGGPLWYLDHGSRALIQSNHCNTVLDPWVVHEKWGTLAGPSPALLVDPIPFETLSKEIITTIHH